MFCICSSCNNGNQNRVRGIYLISNQLRTLKCLVAEDGDEIDSFDANKLLTYNGYIEWIGVAARTGGIVDAIGFQFRVYPSMFQLITNSPFTNFIYNHDNDMIDFIEARRILCGIGSYYNQDKQDRFWRFKTCAPFEYSVIVPSGSSGVTSSFGKSWRFNCPDGEFIWRLILKPYNQTANDREWVYFCAHFLNTDINYINCYENIHWQNEEQELLNYQAPIGWGINGIRSRYRSNYKDRVFKFTVCKINVHYQYDFSRSFYLKNHKII